jgi:hypothetical protein
VPTSDFIAEFINGIIFIQSKNLSFNVKCVTGNSSIQNSFIDNGDGTISDNSTGLIWQKCSAPDTSINCSGNMLTYNWTDALNFCENLNLLGKKWFMPNINEYNSIANVTAGSPTVNITFFPNTSTYPYWSSNTNSDGTSFDYFFAYGSNSKSWNRGSHFHVKCISRNSTQSNLSYSPNSLSLTVGTTILPLSPTVIGNVSSYSVSPALPTGLSLNTTTGVISGTPTTVTNSTTYTISASNSTRFTSFNITIVIQKAGKKKIVIDRNNLVVSTGIDIYKEYYKNENLIKVIVNEDINGFYFIRNTSHNNYTILEVDNIPEDFKSFKYILIIKGRHKKNSVCNQYCNEYVE